MNKLYQVWGLFVVLFCCSSMVSANTIIEHNRSVHHLILAIDWAPSPGRWIFNGAAQQCVRELSKSLIYDGEGKSRTLLDENDYFSCLAFRADVKNNSLKQYVHPICYNNKPLLFELNRSDNFAHSVYARWADWLRTPIHMESPVSFSLLTVAKPFCLNYFANLQHRVLVNRTFMIVVSDHIYNGDMYNEIINLRQYNEDNYLSGIKDDDVYPVYYDVTQSYFIRHIETKEIKPFYSQMLATPKGYAELFEFVPLQKHFQLASVLDFPAILKAKRIRGDKFRCELPIVNRKHAQYRPLKLTASLNGKPLQSWNEAELDKNISYGFEVKEEERPEKVHLASWVRLEDGIYNSTLLSPVPSAMEEAGRNGLNVDLPIEYEEKATIFIVPMPDFLWLSFFPDNQYAAANLWEFILILLIILIVVGCVIRLFIKNQYFTPSVRDINFKIERKR